MRRALTCQLCHSPCRVSQRCRRHRPTPRRGAVRGRPHRPARFAGAVRQDGRRRARLPPHAAVRAPPGQAPHGGRCPGNDIRCQGHDQGKGVLASDKQVAWVSTQSDLVANHSLSLHDPRSPSSSSGTTSSTRPLPTTPRHPPRAPCPSSTPSRATATTASSPPGASRTSRLSWAATALWTDAPAPLLPPSPRPTPWPPPPRGGGTSGACRRDTMAWPATTTLS